MLDYLKKSKFVWSFISRILRVNYSFFWKFRSLEVKSYNDIIKKYFEDEIFLNFFSNKINNLKVVELGCGFGLRLFNLKEQKDYSLIGYDINKKYINLAKKYNEEKKYNIEFCLKKIEDIKLENDVDYLISSFSLIYVKEKDLIKFFINNKDMIRKGFIFIEYHTPSKSENLSYYVHNFQKIFDKTLSNDFEIIFTKIQNKKWIKTDHEAYKIIGNAK
jgi:2-polyprenyl-3-methyl-5-hydroxy-6-metoxy-1,4-benzoquinol methylase